MGKELVMFSVVSTMVAAAVVVLAIVVIYNTGAGTEDPDQRADVANQINTPLPPNSPIAQPQEPPQSPTSLPEIQSVEPEVISSSEPPKFFKSVAELNEATLSEQPAIDLHDLEKITHHLVNEQRTSNGLAPLSWDDEIAVIARRHSEDMARNDYFAHENLQGQRPIDRGNEAGYECIKVYESHYTSGISENLYQGWLYSSTTTINDVAIHDWNTQDNLAETSVEGWMNSEGHRENILTDTYDRAGIGAAIANNDKVYITQNFC